MKKNKEELFLNDIWCLYFHDPFDNDWTNTSYILLSNISSVEQYWENMYYLKGNLHKGMFFLTREGIFPTWDDEANINGGCLSIKILKDNLSEFCENLCISLLGETLLIEEKRHLWNKVNGLSFSPKKHFCIVKIWLRDEELADKKYFNIDNNYYGDILYKSNMDNIHSDNKT